MAIIINATGKPDLTLDVYRQALLYIDLYGQVLFTIHSDKIILGWAENLIPSDGDQVKIENWRDKRSFVFDSVSSAESAYNDLMKRLIKNDR